MPEEEQNGHLHKFNPAVAATHGINAAVVYQCIRWHCLEPKNKSRSWKVSHADLITYLPYLTKMMLRTALSKLTRRHHVTGRLLLAAEDGADRVYSLGREAEKAAAHSFDTEMAIKHGILPAVIYDNMVYWIAESVDIADDLIPCVATSPTAWSKLHPYAPLRTVNRAFAILETSREIGRIVRKTKNRAPYWAIPLGAGKLDRWYYLHSKTKKKADAAKAASEIPVRVCDKTPSFDPDLD
jgi:hypothetical protein